MGGAMTQQEAQELAVKTWGADAIAEIRPTYSNGFPNVVIGHHCYVARSKYGLPSVRGTGETFENAFFESQFSYWDEPRQQYCTFDGTRTNYAKWPEGWDAKLEVAEFGGGLQ
jgi:hypothetical protein